MHEKSLKNSFVVGESGGDIPVGVKNEYDETEVPVYTQSKRTWRSIFWSSKFVRQFRGERLLIGIALDVPKDEARFLTKLDLTLVSASALGVMCRYLDQVNITNAFSRFSLSCKIGNRLKTQQIVA